MDGPILDTMRIEFPEDLDLSAYPFCLPVIQQLKSIEFSQQVTFFVGENGTGKSTILEALAHHIGFGPEGGSKNMHFKTSAEATYQGVQSLTQYCKLSWRKKPRDGYFFRAESFYTAANYLDQLAQVDARIYDSYGGKSLHAQSHGESFLTFFKNRVGVGGFYILDEPEAALSPQRQLALLAIIHDRCKNAETQFVIATHSPLLLAYPDAIIYAFDGAQLSQVAYKDTEHYQLTKRFLDNPSAYFQYLFNEDGTS